MKTYLLDIINRIQSLSERLDNQALLTNQHWVSITGDNSQKTVYIFRPNKELLISTNGTVVKERWDYLGNNSILIDKKNGSYLLKHGFFDENVLALKIDSSDEFVVFVNESKYFGELNNIESILSFLRLTYLPKLSQINNNLGNQKLLLDEKDNLLKSFRIKEGILVVELAFRNAIPRLEDPVFLNGQTAPNGKYKIGFMDYILVENGKIVDILMF